MLADATDGESGVGTSRRAQADVIVMDMKMNVTDATQPITAESPPVKIIGLSLHDSRDTMQVMWAAGGATYVATDTAFETWFATIRKWARASDMRLGANPAACWRASSVRGEVRNANPIF